MLACIEAPALSDRRLVHCGNRLLLWTDALVRVPKVVARQDGKIIDERLSVAGVARTSIPGTVQHPRPRQLSRRPVTLSLDNVT